jgi:arabinofuranan 3-O-arabinosyltransferase
MQDHQARLQADARVQALSGRVVWLVVTLGALVTAGFTLAVLATAFLITSEDGTRALSIDMRIFWAAARLAAEGEALAAFDAERLGAVHNVGISDRMPWLYPPGYQLLILPLGWLSFAGAFLVMTLASVLAIALAVRPFIAGSRAAWLAMVLAPAYLPALIIGQNSLLWLAALLAALAAMRAGRWILAGVLIGLLTLKPQLGVMIPVALLAAGCWRTILAAAATAILLAALPTLLVGPDYWALMVPQLQAHSAKLMETIELLTLMVGPFYLMVLAGLAPAFALKLQWGITAAMALCVYLLWRRADVGFDAKAAGLLLAILLSAPYLWYYEAAMMAAVGLFLVRAGVLSGRGLGAGLLVLLWLGAGALGVNAFLDLVDNRMIGAVLVTPVLLASLATLLAHALSAPRGTVPAV